MSGIQRTKEVYFDHDFNHIDHNNALISVLIVKLSKTMLHDAIGEKDVQDLLQP